MNNPIKKNNFILDLGENISSELVTKINLNVYDTYKETKNVFLNFNLLCFDNLIVKPKDIQNINKISVHFIDDKKNKIDSIDFKVIKISFNLDFNYGENTFLSYDVKVVANLI